MAVATISSGDEPLRRKEKLVVETSSAKPAAGWPGRGGRPALRSRVMTRLMGKSHAGTRRQVPPGGGNPAGKSRNGGRFRLRPRNNHACRQRDRNAADWEYRAASRPFSAVRAAPVAAAGRCATIPPPAVRGRK